MTVVLNSRGDFTLPNFRRVAVGGERIRIGAEAKRAMTRARRSSAALPDSDRAPLPSVRRPASGFGGGFLDERVVRGIVFCRLANLVEGHATARPAIAERVASMLERPLPRIPLDGQVGVGEVLPLAHLLSRLPEGDYEDGEPAALLGGSPCSAALVADTALHARNRLELAHRVFALSIEAFGAPLAAYDLALAPNWGNRWETAALRLLNAGLKGAARRGRRPQQAPVSWEVVPRVLGQAHRAVEYVERAAAASIASVSADPVYAAPSHNGMAYPALDLLTAAWADLVSIADRHTTKLHDGVLGFLQVGFGEKARWAAQRTFLPPSEGGGYGRDDIASPTFLAYQRERIAAACLDASLAILAVAGSRALRAAGRAPAPPLRELVEVVRGEEPGRLAGAFGAYALEGAHA